MYSRELRRRLVEEGQAVHEAFEIEEREAVLVLMDLNKNDLKNFLASIGLRPTFTAFGNEQDTDGDVYRRSSNIHILVCIDLAKQDRDVEFWRMDRRGSFPRDRSYFHRSIAAQHLVQSNIRLGFLTATTVSHINICIVSGAGAGVFSRLDFV